MVNSTKTKTKPGNTTSHATSDYDELMTTAELALFLKVSERKIYGWRMDQTPNTPPYIQVGRSIRYSRRAVQKWIEQQSHQN